MGVDGPRTSVARATTLQLSQVTSRCGADMRLDPDR